MNRTLWIMLLAAFILLVVAYSKHTEHEAFQRYQKGYFLVANVTKMDILQAKGKPRYYSEMQGTGQLLWPPQEHIPIALRCPKPKGSEKKAQNCQAKILSANTSSILVDKQEKVEGHFVAYLFEDVPKGSENAALLVIIAACVAAPKLVHFPFGCYNWCRQGKKARQVHPPPPVHLNPIIPEELSIEGV